jgi:ADP-heptose:LPS heptosyltransferase
MAESSILATPPRRVLLVLHGAIGDVTRALPLLCRLRRGLPATELYWAVEPAAEPLLRHHPALTGVVVFERARGLRAFPGFLRRVRGLRVDWTLDLQRHFKSGLVTLASGARRRVGFHRGGSREGNFLFQSEHLPPMPRFSSKLGQFLQFADHLGVAPAPVEFDLRLRPEEEDEVERLLDGVRRPFAALPVGSTAESRLWFPEETARVIEGLRQRGLDSVLLGAPGEEPLAAAILRACGVPVHDLSGRTSLRALAGVLGRAEIAVAPDSGPMHIAAAMGTPVVSLWGATSAARSAPWGSEDLVLEGSAPCMPCYRKTCPIGRECMRHITPDGVLGRVDARRAITSSPR